MKNFTGPVVGTFSSGNTNIRMQIKSISFFVDVLSFFSVEYRSRWELPIVRITTARRHSHISMCCGERKK